MEHAPPQAATPAGLMNWPGPLPTVPNSKSGSLVGLATFTEWRLLYQSPGCEKIRRPFPSRAMYQENSR